MARRATKSQETLARQAADKGIHPLPVGRRIIARLPTALSVIPAMITSQIAVTSAYGTTWIYRLIGAHPSYVVTFHPDNIEQRRMSGKGAVGGYLDVRGIVRESAPTTFRTRQDAFAAIIKHAGRGDYLKVNPKRNRTAKVAGGVAGVDTSVIRGQVAEAFALGRRKAPKREIDYLLDEVDSDFQELPKAHRARLCAEVHQAYLEGKQAAPKPRGRK